MPASFRVTRAPLHRVALAAVSLALAVPALADSAADIEVGTTVFGQGRFEEAAQAFSRAIDANDLDPDALAITLNNRGVAYGELGRFDVGIEDYTRALSLRPDDPTVLRNLRIAHTRRATAAAARGEGDEALVDYARAIEIEPRHPTAYLLRGQLHADAGRLPLAIEDFRTVSELDPGNADAAALLAKAEQDPAAATPGATPPAAAAPPASPPPASAPPAPGPAALNSQGEAVVTAPDTSPTPPEVPVPSSAGGADSFVAGQPYETTQAVSIRSGPGNEFQRVATVAGGTQVAVLSEHLGWLEVDVGDGRRGFIYRRFLQTVRQ